MEKYKNENLLRTEIMEQERHLFIYGYNTPYRSEFLRSLENDYPLKIDSDRPVALYFDTFGFPKVDASLNDKDLNLISTMSEEFLSFTIATRILEKSMELDRTILNERLSSLISSINYFRDNGHPEIETVEQLLQETKKSRDFYYRNYHDYVNGRIDSIPIDELSIKFFYLNDFIKDYKAAINLDSYFGLIFDKKEPLAISSVKQVNDLICSRINSDICVRVAIEPKVEPRSWEVYYNSTGQFAEYIHDYSSVELDDSYKIYMKTLKKIL